MSRVGEGLPPGYEVVHAAGLHDVAIGCEAKVGILKATKNKRSELKWALEVLLSGRKSPARLGRIPTAAFPTKGARERVDLHAVTAHGITAFGVFGTANGRPTFFITGFDPRDASDIGERETWTAAGHEALRVIHKIGERGGSHAAVSTAR